jgi:hypothetical protein
LDVVERADPTNTTRIVAYPVKAASISWLEALEINLSMSEKANTETLAMMNLRFCVCTKLPAMIGTSSKTPTKSATQNREKWSTKVLL